MQTQASGNKKVIVAIVGARQAGLSISTIDPPGFYLDTHNVL